MWCKVKIQIEHTKRRELEVKDKSLVADVKKHGLFDNPWFLVDKPLVSQLIVKISLIK